ncbi:MAG: hypothetical protein HOV87_11605 [Catenulispora sp.]|nr:hypothetical protein [Catenulispora sp.]
MLTSRNDNARSGADLTETALTPATVSGGGFGLRSTLHVDGEIATQPLFVSGLATAGGVRDVVFVTTRKSQITAFDARSGAPIWAGPATMPDPDPGSGLVLSPLPGAAGPGLDWAGPEVDGNQGCGLVRGDVGILSTPVIDRAAGRMYVVFRVGTDKSRFVLHTAAPQGTYRAEFWLYSLDLATGRGSRTGGANPVRITAPPAVDFAPEMEINRPALLLDHGRLYIAFGSAVCDSGGDPHLTPHKKRRAHGFVFAYDAAHLGFLDVFTTTTETALGGIWQSGGGLAADAAGDVYAVTGNNAPVCLAKDPTQPSCTDVGAREQNTIDNTEDAVLVEQTKRTGKQSSSTDLGNSVIKLHLAGTRLVPQVFTAGNWFTLDTGDHFPNEHFMAKSPPVYAPLGNAGKECCGDADLGSGGPIILPGGTVAAAGKQGRMYVLNTATMRPVQSAFQASYNSWFPQIPPIDYDRSQIWGPNVHAGQVLWRPEGSADWLLYDMAEKDYLRQFAVGGDGRVNPVALRTTTDIGLRSNDGMPGGVASLSANGGRDGVLWLSFAQMDALNTDGGVHGCLVALDAVTLTVLWRDSCSRAFAKFVPPTVADGLVFQAAYQDTVDVFGLTGAPATAPVPKPAGAGTAMPVTALPRPDASATATHLDLFTIGADGSVLSTCLDDAACGPEGWRGWYPIGVARAPAKQKPDDPKPPHFPDHDAAGALITDASHPAAVPGTAVTALWSPASEAGRATHLDLFITDHTGSVMSTFWTAGTAIDKAWREAGWFRIGKPGLLTAGTPISAVWRNANHLDLFATAGSRVVSTYWVGVPETPTDIPGWQKDWFTVPGSAASEATAVPLGQPVTALWNLGPAGSNPHHLDLFAVNNAGQVISTYFDHDKWLGSWFPIASVALGPAASHTPQAVTALWRTTDHLDLFLTNSAGQAISNYWEGSSAWHTWFPVPGSDGGAFTGLPTSQPITALWNPGTPRHHLDLFAVNRNGAVISTYFDNDKWLGGWFAPKNAPGGTAAPGRPDPVPAFWSSPDRLWIFIGTGDRSISGAYWEAAGSWRPWSKIS